MHNTLTETKHIKFDEEVAKYEKFVSICQFDIDFTNYKVIGIKDLKTKYKDVKVIMLDEPVMSPGSVLYGIQRNPDALIWLGQIIDSSD